MNRTIFSMVFAICLIVVSNFAYGESEGLNALKGKGFVTQEQVSAMKNLTPSQRKAIRAEIRRVDQAETAKAGQAEIRRVDQAETAKAGQAEIRRMDQAETAKADLASPKTTQEALGKTRKSAGRRQEAPTEDAEAQQDSLFQRYVNSSGRDADLTGKKLKSYGYNFFSRTSSQSVPANLPVPDNYLIGPGDTISLFLWGRVSGKYALTVDREGSITFPELGPMVVSGMTLKEMKGFLKSQAKQIVGTNISVGMGRLRSIQVYVAGEVRAPGTYLLGALSTVTDALMKGRGLSDIGSLRNVQVRRGGTVVAVMDFYELMQKGDRSGDITLRSGDVVFVPPVGDLVGVVGNIKRPAVYELKGEKGLKRLLRLAGGVIPSAYKLRVQIDRFDNYRNRVVLDVNLEGLGDEEFDLRDGDLVKILSVPDQVANTVTLTGNIKRPGSYQWSAGVRVADIIGGKDALLVDTHMDYALIKRENPETVRTTLLAFNLVRALQGDHGDNIKLQPKDVIHVFPESLFVPEKQVELEGEVRNPDTYTVEENTRVRDVVLLAGGLTRSAAFHMGEIVRKKADNTHVLIKFSPARALENHSEHNLLVQEMDRIVIHSIEEEKPFYQVKITGEVRKPGEYVLTEGETISDLIFRAGGVKASAFLSEAELNRSDIVEGRSYEISRKSISLENLLAGDRTQDLVLKPFDDLFIRRIPEWQEVGTVNITGEVRFPGEYVIEKGERLTTLLERAGGYTDKAFLRGTVFSRLGVRKTQAAHLGKMVLTLEGDLEREAAAIENTADTATDIAALKASIEYRRELLEKMKKVEVPGRLNVRFDSLEKMVTTPDDVVLKDSDIIRIPESPGTVQVLGAVYNPAAFLYRPGLTIEDYLKMAGGPGVHGDMKSIYLAKADGRTLALERSRFKLFSSNRFIPDAGWEVVEEGDAIIVPETTERPGDGWKRAQDFVQFIYRTSSAMASLKFLFD